MRDISRLLAIAKSVGGALAICLLANCSTQDRVGDQAATAFPSGPAVPSTSPSTAVRLETAEPGPTTDPQRVIPAGPCEGDSASRSDSEMAFVSGHEGNDEIYLVRADGTDLRRLTDSPALDWSPTWSPDGSSLVFLSDRESQDGLMDIYMMAADGGMLERLTRDAAEEESLAWSPDGDHIAFVSAHDGHSYLSVLDVRSGEPTRLPAGGIWNDKPIWSPDGKRIAFLGNKVGPLTLSDLYLVNPDGSGLLQLTTTGDVHAYLSQSWSADGTRVVFAAKRNENFDIFVVDVNDGSEIRLTEDEGNELFPAWSPDGSQIAFQSQRDGEIDIYVMNADGTDVRRVTNDSFVDQVPTWSPDGQLLSFLTWGENWESAEIRVSDTQDCAIESLTSDLSKIVANAAWRPNPTQAP